MPQLDMFKPTPPPSVKGCTLIYTPKGRAREYAALACNVYRGCDHQCSYCLDGDTLILRHDLSAIRLRDLRVGDMLLGVSVLGAGRANKTKFTPSKVEAIWTTRKPVYEIVLENGMTAKCSGDHRWLTDRGWKFTVGTMSGPGRRPYLTTNNLVRLLSHPMLTPPETEDYRLGYLSGIIRGDGHIGKHGPYPRTHTRKDRKNNPYFRNDTQWAFSLRLTDVEPLERTKAYLAAFSIAVSTFQFNETMFGIRTRIKRQVAQIKNLIAWRDTAEYTRGFMAGIYDAEGSFSHVLRISNSDPEILSFCEKALSANGFDHTQDVPHKSPNTTVHCIRLRGGRESMVRFWQWCDPAINRKRILDGKSLKAQSRVARITDLGYTDVLYDIQTSTGNFIANGMVSHNCYAPSATRRNRDDFAASSVRPGAFRARLETEARKYRNAGITGKVLLSFTCDPYQHLDVQEKVTRSAIQILHRHGLNVEVLTKGGSRALRDLDLFTPQDAFATTLTLLDVRESQKWEPSAAHPGDRIETIKRFHEAGIPTWVSLEPVLNPYVALDIVRLTYPYVDLYKLGTINHHPLAKTIDWQRFAHNAIALLKSLGYQRNTDPDTLESGQFYIKRDLARYL